ncbi:MAG: nucleotidyltransferase family protein [Chthoniobacterales bacterium]
MNDIFLPVTIADLPIAIDRGRIARFCRERGVRSLSLFGSVLRDDFDPEQSDVDVLAEFAAGALAGVGLRYFGFAEELSEVLGHRVDFSATLHPALREQVSRESVKLYEQA